MNVEVRLARALADLVDTGAGAGTVGTVMLQVREPVTVDRVLDALGAAHPAVERRVRDEAGTLRRHVNVFVGADNARDLGGVEASVPAGTEVSILPAVSGG